jgi:hypothetical protein
MPRDLGFQSVARHVERWACFAWFAALPNSNSLEAISFSVWLAASASLLPTRRSAVASLLRSTPFVLFASMCLLRFASVAWSDAEVRPLSQLSRFLLLPLMLGPLVGSWPLLLGGFIGGTCTCAVVLIARNVRLEETRTYVELITHGKDIGMMCACFAQAFGVLLCLGPALWCRHAAMRLLAFGLIVAGMLLCGQRTAILATTAGLVAYLLMLIASGAIWSHQRRRHAVSAGIALAAVLVLLVSNPRTRDWVARRFAPLDQQAGLLADGGLAADRGPLLRAAFIIWSNHPLLGAGADSFQPEFASLCKESPERLGLTPERASGFSTLTTSHNGLGDELACRGVLGGLIYVSLVASIVWATLRRPSSLALGVAMAIWLAFSLTDAVTLRGTHLAILAVIVTAAAALNAQQRHGVAGDCDAVMDPA